MGAVDVDSGASVARLRSRSATPRALRRRRAVSSSAPLAHASGALAARREVRRCTTRRTRRRTDDCRARPFHRATSAPGPRTRTRSSHSTFHSSSTASLSPFDNFRRVGRPAAHVSPAGPKGRPRRGPVSSDRPKGERSASLYTGGRGCQAPARRTSTDEGSCGASRRSPKRRSRAAASLSLSRHSLALKALHTRMVDRSPESSSVQGTRSVVGGVCPPRLASRLHTRPQHQFCDVWSGLIPTCEVHPCNGGSTGGWPGCYESKWPA